MTCTDAGAVGLVRNISKVNLIGFTGALDMSWWGGETLKKSAMTPRFLT